MFTNFKIQEKWLKSAWKEEIYIQNLSELVYKYSVIVQEWFSSNWYQYGHLTVYNF